jgi:hypothetical protein
LTRARQELDELVRGGTEIASVVAPGERRGM